MVARQSKSADLRGPNIPLRDLVIFMVSGIAGLAVAAPTWVITDQAWSATSGTLMPLPAALVAGAAVFVKSVRALDRIIE